MRNGRSPPPATKPPTPTRVSRPRRTIIRSSPTSSARITTRSKMLTNLDQVPEAGALVMVSFPKPEHGSGFPARVVAILP